ncbi:hypothetical protein ACTXT7_012177 [Hymenolepis weldensis]
MASQMKIMRFISLLFVIHRFPMHFTPSAQSAALGYRLSILIEGGLNQVAFVVYTRRVKDTVQTLASHILFMPQIPLSLDLHSSLSRIVVAIE